MHQAQRFINHVALVLDGSDSMAKHKNAVIQVSDDLVQNLATMSEEKGQETRVSIYKFHGDSFQPSPQDVQCLIFDMDVVRLPSIKDLYTVYGMTALIDAAIKSQNDLATTSQLYGDHGFLSFIVTDGMENASRNSRSNLSIALQSQRSGWHTAWLVPDEKGRRLVQGFGVPDGNIQIWDTKDSRGFVEVGRSIRAATESFMTSRGTGKNWASNGIFGTGPDRVNAKTVHSALKELPLDQYQVIPVNYETRIDEAVKRTGRPYKVGKAYYELSKREEIQPQKDIVIVEDRTGKAFSGSAARDLLGLPNTYVKVSPDHNPDYKIFVQSTSVNRKLVPNTELLVRS